jgi:hypothetical protein
MRRGVFGPKTEEVVGGWRRLHNNELHNFYDLEWLSQEDEMGGALARIGDTRNAYKILIGKTEWKRQFGRSNVGGKITLEQILKEIIWDGVD